MSSYAWMSLMRRVPVLGAAVLLAVLSASAQTPSPPMNPVPLRIRLLPSTMTQYPSRSFPHPQPVARAMAQATRRPAPQDTASSASATSLPEAGAGFNAPIGNDGPFLTWGGNFTGGAGLHLSKRLSVLAEYQFADNKLPGAMIAAVGAQGGNAHIWSLTLDPVIDLTPKWKNGAYITGGGGFYRKVTTFTSPEEVEECDPYYGCGIYYENGVVGHYSSNQLGANVGFGITYTGDSPRAVEYVGCHESAVFGKGDRQLAAPPLEKLEVAICASSGVWAYPRSQVVTLKPAILPA